MKKFLLEIMIDEQQLKENYCEDQSLTIEELEANEVSIEEMIEWAAGYLKSDGIHLIGNFKVVNN